MDNLSLSTLLLAGTGALFIGLGKSGVPGLGILVVPLMAHAFPAKDSVGILLPMLIAGDLMAIAIYRRHAQWRKLLGLVPYVVAGMVAAAFVLARVDNASLRPLLGGLILLLLLLELARMRLRLDNIPHNPLFSASIGASAGFATTVGNAAGPIMSLYLLSRELPKREFVGTAAWFFFVVNSAKVPLYAQLGMITGRSLLFNLAMLPLIGLGAYIGMRLLPRIPQRIFNLAVLLLTGLAALSLLW